MSFWVPETPNNIREQNVHPIKNGLKVALLYGLKAAQLYGLKVALLYGLKVALLYGLKAAQLYGLKVALLYRLQVALLYAQLRSGNYRNCPSYSQKHGLSNGHQNKKDFTNLKDVTKIASDRERAK